MAKRYFSYDFLSSLEEGKFKPSYTLGKHDCYVTRHKGELVVAGSRSGFVILEEGDVLGYDRGNVWVLPRPESYRDPIRRVLARAGISQRILVYEAGPVYYTESGKFAPVGSVADGSSGESLRALLGKISQTKEDLAPRSDTHYVFRYEVSGGDCIMISSIIDLNELSSGRARRLSRIIVRPEADRAEVIAWLAKFFEVSAE